MMGVWIVGLIVALLSAGFSYLQTHPTLSLNQAPIEARLLHNSGVWLGPDNMVLDPTFLLIGDILNEEAKPEVKEGAL